jgi:predicted ester cyclase
MLRARERRVRARRAIELVCSGDDGAAREFYDEAFVDHVNEMEFRGHAGIRKSVGIYRAIFDNLRFVVEDQMSDGDRVVSRWTLHGTHKGRAVALGGVTISRFTGGRIVEDWAFSDTASLIRQLGPRRSVVLGIRWLTGRLKPAA